MTQHEVIEGAVMAALMHIKPDYRSPKQLSKSAKVIADFVEGALAALKPERRE